MKKWTMVLAFAIAVCLVANGCAVLRIPDRSDEKVNPPEEPGPASMEAASGDLQEPAEGCPMEVEALPEAFVPVEALEEEYGDILWFEGFEDAYCALDLDYQCIWQGLFNDTDSIVKYEGALYLSKPVAEQIVSGVMKTAAEKHRAYAVGDRISLGEYRGKEVFLTVESVAVKESGGERTCVIRYSLENHTGGQYAPELFDRVETADGSCYRDFFDASAGSISVQIPSDQALHRIYLRGEGMDGVRTVVWNGE